ncbi:RdgB/HAM1 family non-canonical purine NTP pyrophosphatase [Candidatus Vallotia cooleyia]|uniref:RdgB/HAM1 family non-canonical purine NTP pyrophosphatase n=1 Tax=Candidatus Vallotiella adelgis TaxID=1177211 RepID=UPI001D02D2EA|nr:RdgB/HAM1 family non-canonical purine NTP pyrophosphatase [Candidatus Vallotia cooleyia]UDG82087.1 dITP/XTP pyrophosphatase [Candidatus Vallotia cooleyia]
MSSHLRSALARIVLASNNPSKFREFSALHSLGIDLVPQKELHVGEALEPHSTFIENALEKARHAARITGLPALADDSGLCVHVLGGAPGVYSARYAQLSGGEKSDAANNAHLLDMLSAHTDRRAYYYCALVLMRHANDSNPLTSNGRWYGEILTKVRGRNNFGYDPLFYLPMLKRSVSQLKPEVKNVYSHRARALADLISQLKDMP